MKKSLLLIVVCLLLVINIRAQVAGYLFSQSTVSYDTLVGGKPLGTTNTLQGTYFTDSTVTSGSQIITSGIGLPIGFNFTYNGSNFDLFGVNSNGWIAFGQSSQIPSVNMESTQSNYPISTNSLAPGVLQNRVSAFGRNLVAQTNSRLRYKTIGNAPNRTLVVEWRRYKRTTFGAIDTLNFQIRLIETTNVVEFVYGKMLVSTPTTAQVGLRGTANTDFNNRATNTNWSASTSGGDSLATMALSPTVYPVEGLAYIWSPPVSYLYDAGLTAINAPGALATIGSNNISVTLKNFATIPLTSVSVAWNVDGVLQTPYAYSNPGLAPNATDGPVIIGTYNFTVAGNHVIKAWTDYPNGNADENNVNDTIIKNVYVQDFTTIPYLQNMDNTWINKLNMLDAPDQYWINTPATGNNSWRRDDEGTAAAWTSVSGIYTPTGSNGTTHSARFHSYDATAGTSGTMDAYLNFSPIGTKILKFWYINASGNDSLAIYLSTDGGTTFTYLTKYTTATAWTQHALSLGTSVSPTIVLRFKASSDHGTTDVGIDGVEVYLLAANDMAAVAWASPPSGCGLSNTEVITGQLTNLGSDPQSNIDVYYSIDNGATFVGPEQVPGPVNPGSSFYFNFTVPADFSTPGPYSCIFVVNNAGDQDLTNDTVTATVNSIGTIDTFPFTESFNSGGSAYFQKSAAANAGAAFLDTLGANNTGCAFFTGATGTGWAGSGVITSDAAYNLYITHHSSLYPCIVDATNVNALRMKFDLKQMFYLQRTYTWLVVIANGTDTLTDIDGVKYYNPITSNADPFTTRTFDMTNYAGAAFSLELKSSCKYNAAAGAPGNNNYIDNIVFWVPGDTDAAVTSLISPISNTCGNANDSLSVKIKNVGIDALTNIPVTADIMDPLGAHHILNNTLAGPLSPNTSGTLALGHFSTLIQGTYHVTAYTHMTADSVLINDTAHYVFDIYPPLTIPHLEDYQGGTPLANWTLTNILSGALHGNASVVMYATISAAAPTAKAVMNKRKIGPVTNLSYLTFDYRIVNSPTGTTGTALTTDSVFVLVSGDCGATYDTIHVITAANHVTSTAMKHVALPLSAYAGDDIMPGFYVKRGTAGLYYLDIDNVAVSDAAVVDLGPDSGFCPNGNITLDAGASAIGYTYSYNWNTLMHPASIATTQTIIVDSIATYITEVDNGYGVITADSVVVVLNPLPVVSLGPDTTNCGNYIPDPGAGFASYTWSTGATSQSINVTQTGTYWVDVTNSFGCVARDSVNITIIPLPVSNAGPDQITCYIDTLFIVNSNVANNDSLLWTSSGDGHFTDSTLLHPGYIAGANDITSGTVDLTLIAYANCGADSSVLTVTIANNANAVAVSDVTICDGTGTQLTATGGNVYIWSPSTGLSDANIANPIASPNTTTTYTVQVISSCGSATDDVTVNVEYITAPDLGPDNTFCPDGSVVLDAGSGYDAYHWSNGATSQTITVDTTVYGIGSFNIYVDVTKGVCTASDTVNITFISCVGIAETRVETSVNIFPNPTDGKTTIEVKYMSSNAILTIYNLEGRVTYSEKIEKSSATQLDLSDMPAGVYMVRIYNEKENIFRKLVIQ